MDNSFPRHARLRGRSNFLRVFAGNDANRRRGRWCEIVFAVSDQITGGGDTSFGIAVSRQAGNAVRRNRLKRIIRELLRQHKELWPENKLAVIRIKSPVTDEAGLLAELEDMLKNWK